MRRARKCEFAKPYALSNSSVIKIMIKGFCSSFYNNTPFKKLKNIIENKKSNQKKKNNDSRRYRSFWDTDVDSIFVVDLMFLLRQFGENVLLVYKEYELI